MSLHGTTLLVLQACCWFLVLRTVESLQTNVMRDQAKLAKMSNKASWASVVSIEDKRRAKQHCTGTIIKPDAILTAASCFAYNTEDGVIVPSPAELKQKYKIIAVNPSKTEGVESGPNAVTEIVKVVAHANFTNHGEMNYTDNIAIVKVNPPFEHFVLNPSTGNARLVFSETTPENDEGKNPNWPEDLSECKVAIWQSANESNKDKVEKLVLHSLKVQIVDRATCDNERYYNGQLPPATLCAGTKMEDGDSWDSWAMKVCMHERDIGGPLICPRAKGVKHEPRQFGIVSYSKLCPFDPQPAPIVITELRHYRSWIYDALKTL